MEAYYAEKLREKREGLAFSDRPIRETRKDVEEQVRQDMMKILEEKQKAEGNFSL